MIRHVYENRHVNGLSSSHFDPIRLTVFVVHAWTQNRKSELNVLIREALSVHVVESAGATVMNKVQNIVDLDPAGLLSSGTTGKRLDATDGVVHTNGKLLRMEDSIGHVDYYPKGEMAQPGLG